MKNRSKLSILGANSFFATFGSVKLLELQFPNSTEYQLFALRVFQKIVSQIRKFGDIRMDQVSLFKSMEC